MAKRNNLTQDEATRKRIQTSQLINRLNTHALSDKELMTNSQVNAAKILLNKSVPDLSSMTLSGDKDRPLFPEKVEVVLVKSNAVTDS